MGGGIFNTEYFLGVDMWWMIGFSFVLSVLSIPVIIIICKHYGFYDSTDERKIHKGNIPRLGGVGIIFAFITSSLTYFIVSPANKVTHVLPLIIAGSIIFIFALADDFLNLKAIFKLLVQILAVSIVVLNGYRFKQICGWILPDYISYPFTFFWMLGIINAFNLIDGLDGLCGGLSFLIISSLGIIFFNSARATAAICFMLSAAILGFLVYNKPQAKIFMGDCGSQFIGFMISALPLYYSTPNFEYNKVLVMIVLTSIPILDTIAAIWRRAREHTSFMTADSRHIHHKLITLGFSKVQTLLFLLGIQIFLCLASGLGMYLKKEKGAILLIIVFVFMILFYSSIHFIYYAVIKTHPVDINAIRNDNSELSIKLDKIKSDKSKTEEK